MSRFLTVLLALVLLVGTAPLGFFQPAKAQKAEFTICQNGVIVRVLEPCPAIPMTCKDGTKIGGDVGREAFCASHGGVADLVLLPNQNITAQPAAPAESASTSKCSDGTAISNATVAKGRSAMASFCAKRGGIKGSAGGTK